jgi:hypothetical protein
MASLAAVANSILFMDTRFVCGCWAFILYSKRKKLHIGCHGISYFILLHCNEKTIYIFLFWELRDLSPNFHIHVSVTDLYIPRIGLHISCSRLGRSIVGIYKSLTGTWLWPRNSSSGNIFPPIFGIGSLLCRLHVVHSEGTHSTVVEHSNATHPAFISWYNYIAR